MIRILIILLASTICLTGCAHDAQIFKIFPAPKSTLAENIDSVGHLLGGARDRLTKR